MASEDLFVEGFSEDIIAELDQHYVVEGKNVEDESTAESETNTESLNIDEVTKSNAIAATTGPNDEVEISKTNVAPVEHESKLFLLPLSRVRNIMKLDPDVNIASHESVFLVTRATELFIESLARESYSYTTQAKKKTVQKRDVDLAISAVDSLMFLEGAMNF